MKKAIEELIDIRFHNLANDTNINRQEIFQLFTEILRIAKARKAWDPKIVKIIVSDNFNCDVEEQANIWDLDLNQRHDRGLAAFSKCFQNPNKKREEFYLFFPMVRMTTTSFPIYLYLVIGQMSQVVSRKIIPKHIRVENDSGHGLRDFIGHASTEWCKVNYSERLINGILDSSNLMEHDAILTAFKRKLKRLLYVYNSDKLEHPVSLWNFWIGYSKSIETLLVDIIRNSDGNREYVLSEDKETSILIYEVASKVNDLTQSFINKDNLFTVEPITTAIIKLSNYFSISLDNTSEDFSIFLSKHPKDYFLGIVDTEPRIVCFVDILGFSDLINIYDEDLKSTVLQDIQESFFHAKKYVLDDTFNFQDKDRIKHLKYQSFSDNICISIPYFDNESDFIPNFHLLVTYIQSFQFLMMRRGFFTRGGISLGSYYADDSIIFSKGLVKAYHLESKKALYPRVVIDPEIIEKIKHYDVDLLRDSNLHRNIIFDWENTSFLNPFGLLNELGNLNTSFSTTDNDSPDIESYDVTIAMRKIISNLVQGSHDNDFSEFEYIKQNVISNLYLYTNNSGVATKYTWLLEFMKWLEEDDSGSLKFYYYYEHVSVQ